jgi:hypothetical protein
MVNKAFPQANINTVPAEGADPMMEYTKLTDMDIGARRSGMPKTVSSGPRSIEHVGKSAGKKG